MGPAKAAIGLGCRVRRDTKAESKKVDNYKIQIYIYQVSFFSLTAP